MSKTTFKIMNKGSVAAQRKAWNILAEAYGKRNGVEIELEFEDKEENSKNEDNPKEAAS